MTTVQTAAEAAKHAGFKTLKDVAEQAGVTVQTLNNWHNDRPDFFQIVLAGCAATKARLPITVMRCQCGDADCQVYQLGGIGRFTHGCGFAEDEAHLIAALLNKHRERKA
jgi:hypothetical protein